MTIDRACEILDPEHREHYESIEPVNEACRMGIAAMREKQERERRGADLVEVIRCKDCMHMEYTAVKNRYCRAWGRIQTMGDDGFCNFAERRDDNAAN